MGANDYLPGVPDLVRTHFKQIPANTWTRIEEGCPVWVISQATVPASAILRSLQEPADADAQTSYDTYTSGAVYVPSKGIAWIKHNGANPENFKIVDARMYGPNEIPAAGPSAAPVVVGAVPNRFTFATGQKTVAVAGTAEVLPTQAVAGGSKVAVKALPTNTGKVYVGSSQVNAQTHTTAWILSPGDPPLMFSLQNWNAIWIDVQTAGEGVQIGSEV